MRFTITVYSRRLHRVFGAAVSLCPRLSYQLSSPNLHALNPAKNKDFIVTKQWFGVRYKREKENQSKVVKKKITNKKVIWFRWPTRCVELVGFHGKETIQTSGIHSL